MKSILHPRFSILALALILIILAAWSLPAFAQADVGPGPSPAGSAVSNLTHDTSPVSPSTINSQPSTAVGPADTIIHLAATYPAFATFLILLGTLRLCIKPIMTLARLIAASTPGKADDELLDQVEHSWAYTAFLFALDWLTSIKLPAKSENPAVNKALSSVAILGLLSVFLMFNSGCAPLAPGGVYAGDQILHKSELITTTSYDVIHTYVTWEKENRAALANYPEIKQSADVMRRNAKQWFATANALHDAYAANPTPENGAALTTALAVLQTALNEAVKYMAVAASGAAPAAARTE